MALIYGNSSTHNSNNSGGDLEKWIKENPGKSLNDYYCKR